MKKQYEEIILECVILEAEDVLTISSGDGSSDIGGGFDTPYDSFF